MKGLTVGQARKRGSQSDRIALAQSRERAKFPPSLKCQSCDADLTEITPLSTKARPGIWLLGKAKCGPCDCITWHVAGEPEAVMQLHFSADGLPD